MNTFWEILISIIIGAVFGGVMVAANKKSMTYYKDEYAEFWTPFKYKILFFSVTIVFGFLMFFGYYN